jgi:hypothetical protein
MGAEKLSCCRHRASATIGILIGTKVPMRLFDKIGTVLVIPPCLRTNQHNTVA